MNETNPNTLVRLRGGAEVPAPVARVTFLALKQLTSGEMIDALALYEIGALADDPQHQMWPGTAERLQEIGLLEAGGRMHDYTRDVVRAAVVADGGDVQLVWPFETAEPAADA
jgi:hypothetical protein